MKSLKKIVQRKLLWLIAVLMAVILFVALFSQILSLQAQTRNNADATFLQVRQIIKKSTAELEEVEAEYRETCLSNAETISYVIEKHPTILNNVEEFRQLADKLEIDEIHIFDDTGRIFTGTHPEYFNYTFDSGPQMNFFKPMLENKELRLCQEITPNTAEGKLVQYSALWNSDGKYIIQVGMYPDAVLAVTEKNELSYIFSLLHGNPGVSLYAVSPIDGTIVGSPAAKDNDKNVDEIGIKFSDLKKYEKGAHATVNGVNSYCIFKNVDDTLIGYVICNDQLYHSIGEYTAFLAMCLFVIAIVLLFVVLKYTDRYIIGSIADTNERLRAVATGNPDEKVDVQTSLEFSELSSHINFMVRCLLADTEKMNLVLNRTNLHIGVYEYNTKMQNVRFTERIPEIFGRTEEEMKELSGDYKKLQSFIDELRAEPVSGEENTYRFVGKTETYIKLEEIHTENDVLGIAMDVTKELVSRMQAETERDLDLMTGLYNRRGLERQLDVLFSRPKDLLYGALIMIDCDNLKDINDGYGHAAGDIYLKRLADILRNFRAPKQLTARTGGDEFVLLVYGYQDEREVLQALAKIKEYQEESTVRLLDGAEVPLLFSYGYEFIYGRRDYEQMLSAADTKMYDSKRLRKQELARQKN